MNDAFYCVCGNRVYPATGGYSCGKCFRSYSVKGKLISNFANHIIVFDEHATKMDDETMQYEQLEGE